MRISIIVPSFNQAAFLPRTLDSILGQGVAPHEVIVADGGSTDGSVEVLRDYAARHPQIQWISEPDNGPADAVNKGLARVTGDIIGIQSSDDVYYQGAFAQVTDAFTRCPAVGFVYGDVEGIDEADRVLYRRKLPEPGWPAFFAMSIALPQSSIFFRADLAANIGGWDGSIYGCDIDYWMRLLFHTQAVHIPQALSGWRRYANQRTRPDQYRRIWDDFWRMIDSSADVAAATARTRRLARASKHLLVLRCPPSTSRWVILHHLLIGALLHPSFWRYNPPGMVLSKIPGYTTLRNSLRSRGRAGNHEVQAAYAPVPHSKQAGK